MTTDELRQKLYKNFDIKRRKLTVQMLDDVTIVIIDTFKLLGQKSIPFVFWQEDGAVTLEWSKIDRNITIAISDGVFVITTATMKNEYCSLSKRDFSKDEFINEYLIFIKENKKKGYSEAKNGKISNR